MPNAEVTLALQVNAQLGEGLHWDAICSQLWMTDIHGCRVIRWTPGDLQWQEWKTLQRVGWVIPCSAGDVVLLGLQQGFARARPGVEGELLQSEWLARPFEGQPALRLNDAKADATGALWAGSMNNDDTSRSEGCLFRLAPDGQLSTIDSGYNVANGPAISPDGRWMLHTDSGRRCIYAFDLHVAEGRADGKRLWKRFTDEEGYPDGMSFDAEGCVWVAHWDGGCVSRYAADGRLLRRVRLPASQVSNVCFGGERLDRLFVTTARVGFSAEELQAQPLAGALFEIDAGGVCGLAGRAFGPPA